VGLGDCWALPKRSPTTAASPAAAIPGCADWSATTAGGIGHTLPFLIHSFGMATTVAVIVVAFELAIISWIRARYMDTPWLAATMQVVLGGVLVFLTGILIGSA
jgi:hypothetical protein